MSNKQHEEKTFFLPIIPVKDLVTNIEYIRELNVKIFNTPKVFLKVSPKSDITVTVNVNAQQIEKDYPQFEIIVILNCTSQKQLEDDDEPTSIFEIDLQYGAVVTLPTLKAANIEELLMINAPELLFPEIRNIILNISRTSNLPSILLQPIDFAELWKEKKSAMKNKN